MAQITDAMLKAIMPQSTAAKRKQKLPFLNATAVHYHITTPERLRMWLSAIAQESGQLQYSEEIASGAAYEGRKDLGNTQKGDGKKFKGHGDIQITGRTNHEAYSDYLAKDEHLPPVDFIESPKKLGQEPYATDSAGWFVSVFRNLQRYADAGNLKAYHIGINGRNKKTGLPNGWADRQKFYNRAVAVIPDTFILTESDTEIVDPGNPQEGGGDSNSEVGSSTQIEQTQTVTTDNGTVSQTVTQSNEQDVNSSAEVEAHRLYNGIGFWPTIKKDLAAVGGGNLSFSALNEYATQASGWPPWVIALIIKAGVIIAIFSVAYLLFRLVSYIAFLYKENQRIKLEVDNKTSVTRKDLTWK